VTYEGVRNEATLIVILIGAVIAACGLGGVVVFSIDCCFGKSGIPTPTAPTEQTYSEVLNSAPKDEEEPHTSPMNALNESQISNGLNDSRISEASTSSKRV
jgi:hypothetical protein